MAELNRTQMMERSLGTFIPKDSGGLVTPTIKHHNSTGSPILDNMFRLGSGPGGLPGGKFVEFYGREGAGKTALAMAAIAQAQAAGGLGVLISSEGIDDIWLSGPLNVITNDPNRWAYFEGYTLESALGALTAVIWEFHDAKYPVVVVVDSLSAHGSSENSITKKQMGDSKRAAADAKACHEFNRSGVQYLLSGSSVTPIIIRHQTESPRPYAGELTTHGSSFNYSTWVRLKLRGKPLLNPKKQKLGTWVEVKCTKSKIGWNSWKHSMPLYWDTGWDRGMECVSWLLDNCKKEYKLDKNGRLKIFESNKFPSEWRTKYQTDLGFQDELQTLVYEKFLEIYQ